MSSWGSQRHRWRQIACAMLVLLVPAACIPIPPNTFNPRQFRVGEGPNIVRAETLMGLGAWWDVYDWSPTFTGDRQRLGLADVDRLAAAGVQTMYVQSSTTRSSAAVLDPVLLRKIILRAHSKNMRVVGWYLPNFVDSGTDVARMVAAVRLGFDGFGIDIESRIQADVARRSLNLINESRFLRAAFPRLPIAAIPVTPVIWQVLNPAWWPSFPYQQLARWVDVWMPMAYWTYRATDSPWHDAYRYTSESVTRLRSATGVKWLPVHPIGGLSSLMSTADVTAMNRAITNTYSIGGSLYDDVATPPSLWPSLRAFRRT